MHIEITEHNENVAVTVHGTVDFNNSGELRKAILDQIVRTLGKVIVDLNGVERMDSSGIATLVEAGDAADHHGCRLWLCGINGDARRMLDLVGIDFDFDTSANLGEALDG